MFNKIAIICVLILPFIYGCDSGDLTPEIVDYPPGGSTWHPPTAPTLPLPKPGTPGVTAPEGWLPLAWAEKEWTAIIIHHSATRSGNASIFDKWHKEGRHWEGVGYDFVIGNGSDSGDGQVEPTFRWKYQKVGAHAGGTPDNWANKDGIGICLVGDFDHTAPTRAQMRSLAKLITFLQSRYNIPKTRIYGHGTTPGGHDTDCPGRKFPMYELKTMLN